MAGKVLNLYLCRNLAQSFLETFTQAGTLPMHQDFVILFEKINRFISKYYKNLLVKGLILSLAIIFSFFIVVDVIEYFAWSTVLARTLLFYIFISLSSFVLVFYVLHPIIKLLKIGRTLQAKEAAVIIGRYFPEVSDKLLNAIQLGELESKISNSEYDLLMASISQKARDLKPIPFGQAIAIRKNLKYLKYALAPFLIIIGILLVFPAFITEPSRRIINHTEHFSKPLPYTLELLNSEFSVMQHDDYSIMVKVTGDEIPAQIYINDGRYNYRLKDVDAQHYSYTFTDLNEDLYFSLQTDDYISDQYLLKVLPKPVIFSFQLELDYPSYLERKDDIIENSGDVVVPEGTLIRWTTFTKDVDAVFYRKGAELRIMEAVSDNRYSLEDRVMNSFGYTLFAENEHIISPDSMTFSVQVIKDEYPSIRLNEVMETSAFEPVYYQGVIGDDHGFHKLHFYYKLDASPEDSWTSQELDIREGIEQQSFQYVFLPDSQDVKVGSSLMYYFEVSDNDALHGHKKSKTAIHQLLFPTEEELQDDMKSNSEEVKKRAEDLMKQLDQINKRIEEYKKSLFEKNEMNWLDKNQMMNLLEKEALIQEEIKKLNELNEEIEHLAEQLEEKMSPELQEKMDELAEMMEELMDEEMQQELDALKEELEQMNKDELQQMLQQMQEDNQDLKEELEQSLEMYKQLEVEKKAEAIVEDLEKLSQEEKTLSEETIDRKKDIELSQEQQQELQERFDEVKEDIQEMQELNEALKDPYTISADSNDLKKIDEPMEQADSNLSKKKRKKASENQSQAAEQMQRLSESISKMMQEQMQSRLAEDAEQVKRMLDNLMDLSFGQEDLIDLVANTSFNDPQYIDNADQQQLLKSDYKIVHDSLIALSRRQLMIKPYIIKESETIETYLDRSLASLQDRRRGEALKEQQYIMTSMNNLALMLVESLDKMKQSMNMPGGKESKNKCKNPGEGGPGDMEQLIKMQGKLNKGMQGKANDKGTEGQEGVNGQSEALARMAAQQAEIRRQLSQMLEQMDQGSGQGDALNEAIEEMKKVEEDIINRRITQQTLERQKQLEVRLLKSQEALQEREREERRKSESGKNRNRSNQNMEIEYKDLKEAEEDVLISNPIEMTPYYKSLLKKYRYSIDQKNDGK